jgi:prohibitin 2
MVLLVSLPCVHPEAETYTLYTFLQLEDATKSGGLFLGPPGFHFIKFPSTFITVDVNNRKCVSNDGLLVEFSVTFQVRTG